VGIEPELGIDLLQINLFAVSLLQCIADDPHFILILKSGIAAMVIGVTLFVETESL